MCVCVCNGTKLALSFTHPFAWPWSLGSADVAIHSYLVFCGTRVRDNTRDVSAKKRGGTLIIIMLGQ